jgi:hypothetical protein
MITRLIGLAAIGLMLAAGTAGAAQPTELTLRLKPWDEASKDPSFLKFRDGLKAIIAHKDAPALMTLVAADIKNSFGGNDGAAEFQKAWKPEEAASRFWPALSLVVDLGGNFDSKTVFSAPYVFSAFPNDVSAFDTVVVTADGAVMRVAPKADAAVVRTLDHDILSLTAGAAKPQHEAKADDWVEVIDIAGKHGFVLNRDVRSSIDYRAYFEKRKGRWMMTTFLAGD